MRPDYSREARDNKTQSIVYIYKYYDKRAIPDWIDPFVCEEARNLYFIKDFDNASLEKVRKGDYFIYDHGKVIFSPQQQFDKQYNVI